MRPGVPDVHITDGGDADFAGYRPFVWQAMAAVLISLASPVAFLHWGFLFIPFFSAWLAIWAIRRIGKDATGLSGGCTAWLGLAISVIFLVAVPTDMIAYRRATTEEARQFANLWIQLLSRGEPQKAFQLTTPPQTRQPLDAKLWSYYRSNIGPHADLEAYTKQPIVRSLLEMGAKSQVRFYQVGDFEQDNNRDYVLLWYAVTYEDEGEKRSFFFNVFLERSPLEHHDADWKVLRTTIEKPQGV